MRLLIVDDSKIERMILKEMLESEGHAVEEAEDGKQALKKALLAQPDMIISDILMPVMDGFRLCREIRADKRTCRISFVFYTGTYTKAEDKEFAFEVGADRFLVKSMEWEAFFRELRDVIKEKEMGGDVFPEHSLKNEKEIYKLYNERLIKKLEDKVTELEREVSWRKKLEKQLYESQESLLMAMEGASLGMWDWNVKTGEARFDQPWTEKYEYSPGELDFHENAWEKLLHPDDRAQTMGLLHSNLKGVTEFYENEFRLRDKDGKWRWFLARGKVVSRNESGEAQRHVGTFLDVSDRVEAQKALEKEKEKYRLIFNTAPIGIFHYDTDGTVTECNRKCLEMSGASKEQFVGLKIFENIRNKYLINAVKDSLAGKIIHVEGKYTSVTGSREFYAKADFVPVFSHDGAVEGGVCVVEDISERIQAENELRQSESKYRTILESIEDGYFEVDLDGNLIFFNKALCEILAYPESELKEMNYRSFMDAENSKKTFQTFNKVYETGIPLKGFDWQIVRKNGAICYLDTSVSPIKDWDEKVIGFRGVTRDVSDRRLMERSLADSEKRYRQLLDSAPVGIYNYDRLGTIRACNRKCLEMAGATAEKFIGFNLLQSVSNAGILEAVKKSLDGLTGHYEGEYTSVTGGRTNYIKADFVPIFSKDNTIEGGMCVVEDISKRKKAEEALTKSEKEAQVLLNATTDAAVLLDLDGTVININDMFASRFKKSKEEIIGKCIWNKLPPNLNILRKDSVKKVIETGKPISVIDEFQGMWDYTNIFPVPDVSGNVTRVAVFAQDITDRRKAEEALKESEERYRGLAERSPGIIMLADKAGVCQFVSPSIERILGYRPDEVVGTVPGDFYSPVETARVMKVIARVMKGEKVNHFEVELSRKDGSEAVLELECIPVRQDGRIVGIQYLGRDITDRKVAEKELKKSQRQLQALSKHLQYSREQERAVIAREIHDDLGQLLTAIKMDASWLLSRIPENRKMLRDKAEGTISLIDSAIQSVKRISAELRPGLLDDLGLPAAIEWQAGDYQKRSGINIRVSIDPEEIFLDKDLSIAIFRVCQEALTNIVRHSGASDARVDLSKNNETVELVVIDNGNGISEREISKKNSFGLIGMRERIHSFGGRIKISKTRNGGTKVAVRIPLGAENN